MLMLGLWVTRQRRIAMLFFQEGFTYRNFLMEVFTIFIFIMWLWLLISIGGDLFRRHDISGWGKAIWIIALILIPYIGVLAYVISQGRGMAERNMQQAQQAREELRHVIGFSAADEIEKLDRLKKAGSISDAEFTRLRTQLLT
jgi:phospholipase D-like protein/putative oligomerization/nucleic acid binding protein